MTDFMNRNIREVHLFACRTCSTVKAHPVALGKIEGLVPCEVCGSDQKFEEVKLATMPVWERHPNLMNNVRLYYTPE